MTAPPVATPPVGTPPVGTWTLARIATLLPSLDDARRAPVAEAVALHVDAQIRTCWETLLDDCAGALPAEIFAALRTTIGGPPDTAALLARLAALITPATLLRAATSDSPRLIHDLLSHPDAAQRERAVDALAHHHDSDTEFVRALDSWSRRLLLFALDGARMLSHSERMRLRERLVAERLEIGTAPPSCYVPHDLSESRDLPGGLRAALGEAADDRAAMILAARAEVPHGLVKAAMRRRDAGMLLSICWRAGCDPEETLAVQIQLGRIKPSDAWHPAAISGWPMQVAAMQWRLAVPTED